MRKKEFLSEFLKPGTKIGSVTPSSKFLVKKMIEPIDFNKVKCIVEFGPGTGNITQELLNNMPSDSVLLVFEINKEFSEQLQKDIPDSRMVIINDTAENLETHLSKNNISKVDYIVSSLPFTTIPNETVENILNVVKKVLQPAGAFIQYQYSLIMYWKLKNTFKNIDLSFTPMNFPPAFVFTCSN